MQTSWGGRQCPLLSKTWTRTICAISQVTNCARGSATFVSMFGEDCMLGRDRYLDKQRRQVSSNDNHSMERSFSAASNL